MGTNYYYVTSKDDCPTCGHKIKLNKIHIGKASHGWRFLFQGDTYRTGKEWMTFLKKNTKVNSKCGDRNSLIEDEYGTQMSYNSFINSSGLNKTLQFTKHDTLKVSNIGWIWDDPHDYWTDEEGYWFSSGEFC